MIPILYEKTETEFKSNGLGRLRSCIRCECTEERNGIYEVEFEYPVNGDHYGDISLGRIIAVEHDESGDVQPFDIYSYSRPINGVVTFHARHISYRQRDLVAFGTGVSDLQSAFAMLQNSTPDNPFVYDSDMLEKTGDMGAADGIPRSVREMLGGVEGSILDTYGGEYEWDKFGVTLWRSRGEARDFTIRYGVNMTEFTEDMDYSESYTAVVPYWAKDDTVVRGGMVSFGVVGYDGRESCRPLDLSDKFEDQPTAEQLQNAASSYLNTNQPQMPSRNVKVDFIRLQDSDEYHQFANLQKCRLCDSVHVVFPLYGIEGSIKIVKVVWDVLLERYLEMELGNLSTTLSEALGITSGSASVTTYGGKLVDGSSSLPSSLSAGIDLYTQYGSISLSAGRWLILAQFSGQPSGNSSGCLSIRLCKDARDGSHILLQRRTLANKDSGYYTSTGIATIIELSASATIYAVCTSHYAIASVDGKMFKAIRI